MTQVQITQKAQIILCTWALVELRISNILPRKLSTRFWLFHLWFWISNQLLLDARRLLFLALIAGLGGWLPATPTTQALAVTMKLLKLFMFNFWIFLAGRWKVGLRVKCLGERRCCSFCVPLNLDSWIVCPWIVCPWIVCPWIVYPWIVCPVIVLHLLLSTCRKSVKTCPALLLNCSFTLAL